MRMHSFLALALVGLLCGGGGLAAGYAIGGGFESDGAYLGMPVQYLAATSPPALDVEPGVAEPRYVLGTDEGFVAVFYAGGETLLERTRTPEYALSLDERERLHEGIYIYTEEQLARALQDYGS